MATGLSPLAAPGANALLQAQSAMAQQARHEAAAAATDGSHAKIRAKAQDFEAVFLNTMFQQMFTGIDGEGPFGGTAGVEVWRSFLTDQYARSFAKAGGLGIADHVYRELAALQAGRPSAAAASAAYAATLDTTPAAPAPASTRTGAVP